MVNAQSPFCAQFFHLPVAEGVAAIPMYAPKDNRGHKMTPVEQASFGHTRSDSTDKNLLPYQEA